MSSYTVQIGDTAFSISGQFGISVQQLEALNPGVDFNNLQIGETLNVTQGSSAPSGQTYTVKQGDVAFSISGQFGISVQELESLNPGVDFNNLQIGQVLNV